MMNDPISVLIVCSILFVVAAAFSNILIGNNSHLLMECLLLFANFLKQYQYNGEELPRKSMSISVPRSLSPHNGRCLYSILFT